MHQLSLAFLLVPLLLLANTAQMAEWPLFRGNPQQTGVAKSNLPDKLDVLWQFKTEDAIENAVAVAGGQVFVGSWDEHLYALDFTTGKLLWKQKLGPIKAAPVTRDGLVFVGDLDGKFYCLEARNGSKKWTYEANSEVSGANFYQDVILFSSHDEYLYCLNSAGKLLWKFHAEGPIHGTPSVADGKTFLVGCDSHMRVIDIATGKEVSSVNDVGESVVTAGVVDHLLYMGSMRNDVKAIDWKKSEIVWTYKPGRGAQQFASSPAVTDKYILIGSRDNKLHCLDRAKGTSHWVFPTGNKVDSSPVVAGTRVVFGSQDDKLYILDLESGKSIQVVPLDGPISASPVVVDGKVLIGTQKGTLYCLGSKS